LSLTLAVMVRAPAGIACPLSGYVIVTLGATVSAPPPGVAVGAAGVLVGVRVGVRVGVAVGAAGVLVGAPAGVLVGVGPGVGVEFVTLTLFSRTV